jgi:hypothetical protein
MSRPEPNPSRPDPLTPLGCLHLYWISHSILHWVKENKGFTKKQLEICSDFLLSVDRQTEIRLINSLEIRVRQLVREQFSFLSILEDDLWRRTKILEN